ncbi:MAG TPA: DUF4873 domain-containing protein [Mycobacteriales bacterium]|jgi:hypothetical protein|nr:DUF4873 domain-containing protein [Mycobacteriales bacterium]
MREYKGPAVLRSADGTSGPVHAMLFELVEQASGMKVWSGRVRPDGDGDIMWKAFDNSPSTITIGERTADLIITSYGDDSSELQGSGEPPF